MFDRIFVAGRAGRDRYSAHGIDIPAEKFRIVGRPQVVGIERATWTGGDLSGAGVLYAPTWQGYHDDAAYSSMGSAAAIARVVIEQGSRLIFRPHPYCHRDPGFRAIIEQVHELLRDDTRRTGRDHLFGEVAETEMSLIECFNAADVMIADVSGVLADFLYSEKPFLIVTDTSDTEEFVREFPLARAAYVVDGSPEAMRATLTEVATTDPLADMRRAQRTYYLGDFPEAGYEDAFLAAAAEAAGLRRPSPVAAESDR
nr:CDP-glycerol glycerophosphotransferase family protein [Pseudactinotalea sp. HY160]